MPFLAQIYDGSGYQIVHVINPTQGSELMLVGVGFLCAAVLWRMIVGRW